MKAISLWQPWASLIAAGLKHYETRSWAPPRELIGQTIAIHAAKKIDCDAADFANDLSYGKMGWEIADKLKALIEPCPDHLCIKLGYSAWPAGVIVCTARLDAAFQLGDLAEGTAVPAASVIRRLVSRPLPECFTVRLDKFGNYDPGRWAWLLTNVMPLQPPPQMTGRQGFFDCPQG